MKYIFTIIFVASLVIWGVSRANQTVATSAVQNYSILGIVSSVSTTTNSIYLTNQAASDGNDSDSVNFDLSSVKTIETGEYVQLAISDIQLGDSVILQGLTDSNTININRVIDLTQTSSAVSATSTLESASSTDVIATTTGSLASSTDSVDSTATSTDVVPIE